MLHWDLQISTSIFRSKRLKGLAGFIAETPDSGASILPLVIVLVVALQQDPFYTPFSEKVRSDLGVTLFEGNDDEWPGVTIGSSFHFSVRFHVLSTFAGKLAVYF